VRDMPFACGEHLVSLWGHPLQLPDGRVLWGCICREGSSLCGGVVSEDGARSFRWLADLCPDASVGERREPGLARLATGELLAVLRCGTDPEHPMVVVRSCDEGQH
jgi:hypothetical protein